MGGQLLEDKSIPLAKAVEALVVLIGIVGSVCYILYLVSLEMEKEFHVLEHTASENVAEVRRHPAEAIRLMALFPVLAIVGLALVIPLGPYVVEHAAFQNLHVIRPDHHLRLCGKVYSAWYATNGKLASKDL